MALKSELFNRIACFTEETLIYTKDGYKQIKDIEVGDEVYSRNADTGEQGLKRVLNVFVKDIKELVHLKVGEQEIKTTATHPFWVEGIGWVDAADLKPGDRLVMYSGEIFEVKEVFVEYLDKPIKVYNFEVQDWHTYFVSGYNVFVHNANCGDAGVGGGNSPKSNWADPNIPIEKQLAGKGQLKDLRSNPNLKGVDINSLLKKIPAELEQMVKDGNITQKTLKQIKKAFEGRDLGKRGKN